MRYKADFLSYPAKMVEAKVRVFCAWCKKVEKVKDTWVETDEETYQFYRPVSSHGICLTCMEKVRKENSIENGDNEHANLF